LVILAETDAGYLVLLDKDHLTDGLKPPTYTAYIPTPPTEIEYQRRLKYSFSKQRMQQNSSGATT